MKNIRIAEGEFWIKERFSLEGPSLFCSGCRKRGDFLLFLE
jgi:hypothetical protein